MTNATSVQVEGVWKWLLNFVRGWNPLKFDGIWICGWFLVGCVFFEKVLSPSRWQNNLPKFSKSRNVGILSIEQWFYIFPSAKIDAKHNHDALARPRHVLKRPRGRKIDLATRGQKIRFRGSARNLEIPCEAAPQPHLQEFHSLTRYDHTQMGSAGNVGSRHNIWLWRQLATLKIN